MRIGLTWGRKGETPVVKDSGGRFGLSVISGVTPRGDMRFSFIEGTMNSTRFYPIFKAVRGDAGKPVIVIIDNARYHHSKETQALLRLRKVQIKARLPWYFCPLTHRSLILMNKYGII